MKNTWIYLLVILLIMGCTPDEIVHSQNTQLPESVKAQALPYEEDQDKIVLGDKLSTPYSVDNMKEAYNNLQQKGTIKETIKISTTHYYVRFLPKNESELGILLSSSIELFSYPLDYEIENEGSYYHDPSIPEDKITWQYANVPVDYEFPDIQYEILNHLFLIDETNAKANGISLALYDTLLKEALTSTANKGLISFLNPLPWNPSGCLYYYDDVEKKSKPIEGVIVRASGAGITKRATTNENGCFSMGLLIGPAHYSVKWEFSNKFDLRTSNHLQAYSFGPFKKGSWHHTFHKNRRDWGYAVVFRAARIYFTQHDRWGIQAPPSRILGERLHIGVLFTHFNGIHPHFFDRYRLLGMSPIVVAIDYLLGSYDDNAQYIFATTIHELAHASHSQFYDIIPVWIGQSDGGRWLVESWATGVENTIVRDTYNNPGYHDQHLKRGTSPHNHGFTDYSAVIEDLIDDLNQRMIDDTGGMSNGFPVGMSDFDLVSYYDCYGGTVDGITGASIRPTKRTGAMYGRDVQICDLGKPKTVMLDGVSGATTPQSHTQQAFVAPNPQGNFYFTRFPSNTTYQNCVNPFSWDGYRCRVYNIPDTLYGFIINNQMFMDRAGDMERINDHVEGYTLGQIEDVLKEKKPKTAGQFKKGLKDMYNNPTERYLDELFANYGY